MLIVLLGLIILFAVLLTGRVGGARRTELMKRWPALLLAGAALIAFARGLVWPGILFALAAGVAWELWPRWAESSRARPPSATDDPAAAEARAILGVGPNATPAEIRSAYRAKMARTHPDRGGAHAEAARLTAARDRLLKKKA